MSRRGRAATICAAVAALALSGTALGHSIWVDPAPRAGSASGDVTPPCATARGTVVTDYAPGAVITVRWQEVVRHGASPPGGYAIRFSAGGDANFQTLASDIPYGTGALPQTLSATVTLPSTPTADGTLQLVQTGTGAGSGPYYSCANIRIVSAAPPPPPPPPPSPPAAGAAPKLTIATAFTTTITKVRSGGVRIPMSCDEECQVGAVLYITRATARSIGLPASRARVPVGSARTSITAGTRRTLTVRITAAFRRTLADAAKRVTATLETTATDAGGLHATAKTRVTLRP